MRQTGIGRYLETKTKIAKQYLFCSYRLFFSVLESFFKNGPSSASFSFIFVLLIHIIIFTTNKCEQRPSSTQCRDSNSRTLEHESPPITTRPGLSLFVLCAIHLSKIAQSVANLIKQFMLVNYDSTVVV